jgi:predicted nucleotidyltransferase
MGHIDKDLCAALEGFQLVDIPRSTTAARKAASSSVVALASQFAVRVRNEIDPAAEVYLFGSTARSEAGSGSDIDIAVISKLFGDDVTGDFGRVNVLAFEVNSEIEAHPIVYEDWVHMTPFTAEIKRDGIAV